MTPMTPTPKQIVARVDVETEKLKVAVDNIAVKVDLLVERLKSSEQARQRAEGKVELLETAWRSRGFVCQWSADGTLTLVTLGEAALAQTKEKP